MKNILYFIFPLVINYFLESISCNGTCTNFTHMEWNFVEQFGKKSNVHNWVLYHDPSSKDSQPVAWASRAGSTWSVTWVEICWLKQTIMYIHLFVFGTQQPARILNHRVKTVGDPDVRYREGVKSKLFKLLADLLQ